MTTPTVPAPTVLPHDEEGNGGLLLMAGVAVLVLLILAIKGLKERFEQHEQDTSDRFDRIERRVFVPATAGSAEPEGNKTSGEGSGSSSILDRSGTRDHGVSPSGDTDGGSR